MAEQDRLQCHTVKQGPQPLPDKIAPRRPQEGTPAAALLLVLPRLQEARAAVEVDLGRLVGAPEQLEAGEEETAEQCRLDLVTTCAGDLCLEAADRLGII